MRSAMRSASLLRKITDRCARSSVSLGEASCANVPKDSITMQLRHHARSGAGENAVSPSRKWSRNYPAISRMGGVMVEATGSVAVRLPRHAVRGEDRARVFSRAFVVTLLVAALL